MSTDNPFDLPSDPVIVDAASAISTNLPEGNPFASMTGGVQQTPTPALTPTQQPTPMTASTGFSGFNEQPPQAQPQQGGFGGFQQPSFGGGGNQPAVKRKYKFVQMYWLINPKLFAQQQLAAGEAPLIEISYNVDYGNARISFIKINNTTFDATSIRVQNTDRQTTVNIYAETADQVLYHLEKGIPGNIQVFERMIQASASWSPNKTNIVINQDGSVTLNTQPSNSQTGHSYTFSGWQIESLKKVLKFLTEGSAYVIDIAKFLAPAE